MLGGCNVVAVDYMCDDAVSLVFEVNHSPHFSGGSRDGENGFPCGCAHVEGGEEEEEKEEKEEKEEEEKEEKEEKEEEEKEKEKENLADVLLGIFREVQQEVSS